MFNFIQCFKILNWHVSSERCFRQPYPILSVIVQFRVCWTVDDEEIEIGDNRMVQELSIPIVRFSHESTLIHEMYRCYARGRRLFDSPKQVAVIAESRDWS